MTQKPFLKPKILFLGIENDLFFPFFWRGELWQRSWPPSLTLKNVNVLFTTSLKIRLKNITLVIFNLNSLFSIPPPSPPHTLKYDKWHFFSHHHPNIVLSEKKRLKINKIKAFELIFHKAQLIHIQPFYSCRL